MAVPSSPLNNAKLLVTIAARSATNSDQAMSRSYPWPSPSLAQWPDPFTGTRGLVAFRARRRPARGAGAAVGRRPGRAGRDLLLPRRASPKAPRRLAWGTFWPGRVRVRSPQTADARAPARPPSAGVEARTLPEEPVEKNPSRNTLHDGGEGEDRLHQRLEEERHLRPFLTGCRVSVGAVRTPTGADNRSRLAPGQGIIFYF